MEEIWRDIESYEGLYQVSNMGRIRSLDRVIRFDSSNQTGNFECKRLVRGQIMSPKISARGREELGLRKGKKKTMFRVDILVTKAFLDNPYNITAVKNIDGDLRNNKVSNLKYDDGIESLDGEIWKDILEYEGLYQISNFGRVKGLTRAIIKKNGEKMTLCEKLIKSHIISGYLSVMLSKVNEGVKNLTVHRLIGIAFIPNPLNKSQINHIDGNKLNNSINNLEWVDAGENIRHAYDTGLHSSHTTPVIGINIKTNKKINFNLIADAVRYLRKNGYPKAWHGSIGMCCKGRRNHAYGHKWEYQNKNNLKENSNS